MITYPLRMSRVSSTILLIYCTDLLIYCTDLADVNRIVFSTIAPIYCTSRFLNRVYHFGTSRFLNRVYHFGDGVYHFGDGESKDQFLKIVRDYADLLRVEVLT